MKADTLALFLLLRLANALCYTPDGSLSDDVACNPADENSICCTAGFLCLSNGLCQTKSAFPAEDRFIRGTCTDKSWKAPECRGFCVKENPGGGEYVMRCNNATDGSGGSWCCADENCCADTGSTKLHIGEANITATAGVAPTQTSASSPSGTEPAASSTTSSGGGLSQKQSLAIGLGVGISSGLTIAVILMILFIWHRKRQAKRREAAAVAAAAAAAAGGQMQQNSPADTMAQGHYYSQPSEYSPQGMGYKPVQEMDNSASVYQLPAGEYAAPAELSGSAPNKSS